MIYGHGRANIKSPRHSRRQIECAVKKLSAFPPPLIAAPNKRNCHNFKYINWSFVCGSERGQKLLSFRASVSAKKKQTLFALTNKNQTVSHIPRRRKSVFAMNQHQQSGRPAISHHKSRARKTFHDRTLVLLDANDLFRCAEFNASQPINRCPGAVRIHITKLSSHRRCKSINAVVSTRPTESAHNNEHFGRRIKCSIRCATRKHAAHILPAARMPENQSH